MLRRSQSQWVVLLAALGMLACHGDTLGPDPTANADINRQDRSSVVPPQIFTYNVKVPFEEIIFVPCAAAGAGESVEVEGVLHIVLHDKYAGSADHDVGVGLWQTQRAVGTGLTTGDTYRATSLLRYTQTVIPSGYPESAGLTLINKYRLVGPGPNNNLYISDHWHLTMTHGVVTANFTNESVTCS